MKANELQIINFLQAPNVQFVVPVYQRNYDWTTVQCGELLKDILSVETEKRGSHFIGSIVFIHEGAHLTNEVKELVIIDGQQRLTTLNILYVALYRFAKDNGLLQEADRLYNMFLTNQFVQEDAHKLKLKQTDQNALAFNAILSRNESQFLNYSNVIENFNFFKSRINEENFNIILDGLNRLIFVEISLERGKDDPQRIFESLNSTGLALSQSDLIRNYILMDLPPTEQKKVFSEVWNPIEENAKDVTKQKSLVSEYIRDYLTLKNKKIPNKSKVYDEFKKLYFNEKSNDYYQELEKIKTLSIHYRKFINPQLVPDKEVRKELEYIDRLEINVAYPFLLQVFEDADNGLIEKDELIKILQLIQSYTWRRFVLGLPTNALNKIFMALYSEVDVEDYYESIERALVNKKGSSKFPTDEDIKTALKDRDLYNIQAKNRNYLFELLENYNNKEYVNTANEHITVEHIFPRNPDDSWKEDLSIEDYSLFKDKFLNTIGNLTLSGNNGSLSNKSFLEKQQMNTGGKEQGYKYSRLWLNTHLNSIDSWNVENYNKRLELIYQRFLSIWKYPHTVVVELDESEEQNIFDAESPTHKKLEYFIFENTKVEEETITQMFYHVIRQLYEKNSQLLLSSPDALNITRKPSGLRTPLEIANGWYIESNVDSNSKFNTLKRLLSLFGLEDELFIKYGEVKDVGSEPNRFNVRRRFWKQLLPTISGTGLFSKVSPSRDHWLNTGAGVSGVSFTLVVTRSYVRIELTILTSSQEVNKRFFKKLLIHKDQIEESFGSPLIWEELPNNKMSRIKYEMQGVSVFDESDWEGMNIFIVENLPKFEKAFRTHIENL